MTTQIFIITNLLALIVSTALLSDSLKKGRGIDIVVQASLSVLAAWLLICKYIPTHWGLIP